MEATKLDVLENMNDAEIQEAWRVLRVSRDLDAFGLFPSPLGSLEGTSSPSSWALFGEF